MVGWKVGNREHPERETVKTSPVWSIMDFFSYFRWYYGPTMFSLHKCTKTNKDKQKEVTQTRDGYEIIIQMLPCW